MRIVVALSLLLVSCTTEADTVRTLRANGFTDIQTTGWSPFVCSKDDTFETGFRAKNARGETVTGTVCCGFLTKGCTVRF